MDMIHGEENPFGSWRWREWLIVFGVSTGIGLLFVFQNYVGMSQESPQYKWNELVIGLLSYWYVWALLFPFIVWMARRYSLEAGPSAQSLRWHIPAFVFVPVLHIAIYALFLHAVDGDERPYLKTSIMLMKSGLFFRYLTYAFLLATSYSIDYYRHYKERELRTSRLEAKLVEAQLQALKSQIHPHFLFNTLNAISSLMHKNVEAADEAISRLADLLRATLEANGAQEVTLRQELDLLKQYIEIEKLRLGERLIVAMDVQPDANEAMVPNLLLQPIVENAIRYGVATQSRTGTVTVSASGFGFNVGVQYNNLATIEGLSIGVVVKNIGPQMTFTGAGLLNQASVTGQNRPPQFYSIQAAPFDLPSSIEFGLGYKRTFTGDNSLLFSTGFQSNNFSDDEYKLGLEYAYEDLFFVRGGYDLAQKESADLAYIYGPTFGDGVHTALGSTDITFDYAYRSVKVFSGNHVFSVKLGF